MAIMSGHDFGLLLPALRALSFSCGALLRISQVDLTSIFDDLARSFEETGFESRSKDA